MKQSGLACACGRPLRAPLWWSRSCVGTFVWDPAEGTRVTLPRSLHPSHTLPSLPSMPIPSPHHYSPPVCPNLAVSHEQPFSGLLAGIHLQLAALHHHSAGMTITCVLLAGATGDPPPAGEMFAASCLRCGAQAMLGACAPHAESVLDDVQTWGGCNTLLPCACTPCHDGPRGCRCTAACDSLCDLSLVCRRWSCGRGSVALVSGTGLYSALCPRKPTTYRLPDRYMWFRGRRAYLQHFVWALPVLTWMCTSLFLEVAAPLVAVCA
jgi:hypothetical protein